jgi:hypothetical protein
MSAFFNGYSLGLVESMPVAPNSQARQINVYPGANGLEVINQGSRGKTTVAAGIAIGPSVAGLAAVEQTFINLVQDGGGYLLIDTLGRSWSPVILTKFQPHGRAKEVVGPYGLVYYGRAYDAEFLHTT